MVGSTQFALRPPAAHALAVQPTPVLDQWYSSTPSAWELVLAQRLRQE